MPLLPLDLQRFVRRPRLLTRKGEDLRWAHAMVYHGDRRRVLLFGGYDPAVGATVDDTWEYDGLDWTEVSTAHAPGPREQHAMTYDAERRRVVLVWNDETWEYGDLDAAPLNLPGNPDFGSGLEGWNWWAQSAVHQPGDGVAAPGSAELVADPESGNAYGWTCIDVSALPAGAHYVFGGWTMPVDFDPVAADARSAVQANFYSSADCQNLLDVEGGWEWWSRRPSGAWRRSSWGGNAPPGTHSILLFVGMVQVPTSPPGRVRVDDAFLKVVRRPQDAHAVWALDGDLRDQAGATTTSPFGEPQWGQGRFGRAVAFDGDDFLQAALSIDPAARPWLTMGAWVRADAGPTMVVLSHDNGDYDRTLALDNRGPGGEGWSAFRGKDLGVMGGTEAVQIGQMQFVAVTFDDVAGTATLYADGGLERASTNFGPGEAFVALGRNPLGGDNFVGLLDEVFVFDRVLSPEEIDYIRIFGISLLSDHFESGDLSSWPIVAAGGP